ncbi:MAG: hypothetical protein OPY08_00575 [Nitrosopumilus sp.]|nr:hypothetical protein [Nitrosopumilus sp.]MDF2424915.1 hypothetical protein [Nitrosopumilus sp.]MDF2428359.1 hypothetical protein [Nitrosopumilus sp.]
MIFFTMISFALVYAETIPVDVNGTSFDVEYTATGMTVSGIVSDTDFVSLILTVDVTESSGTLDITLDRSLLDSTFQGLDDDFIILADGDEPNFSEVDTSSQSRTLSIELPAGTEEIEIIGSAFGDSTSIPSEDAPEPELVCSVLCIDGLIQNPDGSCECVPEPVVETPKPVVETPKPVVETPKPVVEAPKTQCGPGTVLKDGSCVLDERCGPGTVLEDGACVIDPTSKSSGPSTIREMGTEFAMGMIITIVIIGAIVVVFLLLAVFGNQFGKWTK